MKAIARPPAHPGETFNRRGFWALIVTQFQGAFNDNLYQFIIIFFLLSMAMPSGGDVPADASWLARLFQTEDFVYAFAQFIFAVPFIIFPALFGALADKYSKQRVAIGTKYLEIFIMALGGVAFYMGSSPFCWFVLFCMATQSAIFSPAKYGIIPEIMPEPRLSWANGILQMGTILAIIAGTGLAGAVSETFRGRTYLASVLLVVLSILGTVSSHFITKPPAAYPQTRIPRNPLLPWAGMGRYFRAIWSERLLYNVVLGYVYFWFGGALVRQSVMKFAHTSLGLSDALTSYWVATMGLGIGVGAVAAGYLSREKIETGIVPVGALGMGLFSVILGITGIGLGDTGGAGAAAAAGAIGWVPYVFVIGVLFWLGFFAGFFDVPLAAAIQARAPLAIRGGVIATTNMLTFVGIAFASVFFYSLSRAGLSPSGIFFVCALMSAGMGLYISFRIPSIMLRAALWILANTLYRIRVLGRNRIPEEGGALFVANHLSVMDALALTASTDRDICFLMGKDVFNARLTGRIARMLGVIPFDPRGSVQHIEETIVQLRALIAEGNVVCIPAERRFAADGVAMPYHDDYQRILGDVDAPLVPVHLSHLWGSIYTVEDGRFHALRPPRIPHVIHVHYGDALPRDASAVQVRAAIQRLGTESYMRRPLAHNQLHRGFIKVARKFKRRMCIADAVTGELNYFKTLVGSIAFARKLRRILDDRQMVGVLVPPSVGGALTNIALQIMGRVPVNLNYTSSKEAMASAARQCGITQVLTSKRFLERLPLEVPGHPIYLEDIRGTVTAADRVIGMLYALFAPAWLIERAAGSPRGRTLEDLATIIFSSGSEGDPKGVMLTQRNILSNIEAGLETFPHGPHDRMMAFLPFFHSFGFTVTMWLMFLSRCGVVYHANPLEPRVIGGLIKKFQCTFLVGTPTFLNGFLRRCDAEQLKSLSWVVCGAEKLPEHIREAYREKFDTTPMEGYGCTECAPAVSTNTPDFISPGFYARGVKHGSIGRPLPGISIRIVDPATGLDLPPGEAGLMLIKGVNVMKGYLNMPEKTAAVLRDGWYETGDIASVDEDGFITITDRMARFSKIAGEMVPHAKVEETLHQLLNLTEQALAVASIADPRKGERLVVLHTLDDAQLAQLLQKLPDSGLPNLWRPRASAFHRIDALPVLGTGKMDIRGVRTMAQELDHDE